LESEKSTEPKAQPPVRQDRDWISQLAVDEADISDGAAFFRMIGRTKMIHVVTGGARPKSGKAGWCAIAGQNMSFTLMWRHFPKATSNTMELRAVTEVLNFLPEGMVVWGSSDPQSVRQGLTHWITSGSATVGRTRRRVELLTRLFGAKLIQPLLDRPALSSPGTKRTVVSC
jgi:hypothetical protein